MFVRDLFEKHMGTDLELCRQEQVEKNHPDAVRYVSRTAKNNGVTAYIKRINKEPSPGHVLSVACGGSVLSTFYQDKPFYSGRDLYYLFPKRKLSVKEMIFYAMIIEQNKYKYNYGRQANRTLEFIEIPSPDEIPEWVYTMEIPTYDDISESKTNEKVELPPVSEWKSFKYEDLFDMKLSNGRIQSNQAKNNPGNTPFVATGGENNGIAYFTDDTPDYEGNVLTVATTGTAGACFYQKTPFNARTGVLIMELKDKELTPQLGIFFTTLFHKTAEKYCYGRGCTMGRVKQEDVCLPVDKDDNPNWDLMECYINSLPYSKYL